MKKNTGNKSVFSWYIYDIGQCSFATVIMAVVLPVYYENSIAGGAQWALSSWGYASSAALLLSAILTPVIGTFTDGRPLKKRFLASFAALGVIASAALAAAGSGMWFYTLLCMVTGSVALAAAGVCYDSLLPSVAPPGKIDRVSATGFGIGYLGAGILLALDLLMISLWGERGVNLSFVSVALCWGLTTVPLMRFVPEPAAHTGGASGLGDTFRTLARSWSELKEFPEALRFMISFWLYNDGIGTIIRMAAIFGAGMGIPREHLVGAMLLTQFVGVPFALIFASLAEHLGSKRALMISLFWYTFIALGAMFINRPVHFWMMAVAVGMVQGGAQAISRSLFASMLPAGREGHFFGLYNVSGKFAGVVGPALCATAAELTGSIRASVGIIALSFVAGALVLKGVNVKRGRRRAIEAA